MTKTILDMRDIRKAFGPVKALSGVNLTVGDGEIHAICGENGAGKSTLMKILSGVIQPTSGEIVLDGIDTTNLTGKTVEVVGAFTLLNPKIWRVTPVSLTVQ